MCFKPLYLKKKKILVPCGKCPDCKRRSVNAWVVKMELERRIQPEKSLFLTLTYNEESINKDKILIKKDYQNFLKRLRFNLSKIDKSIKIKYFCCGEYGEKFFRPHFHFILFGLPYNQFTYNLILRSWGLGFIYLKPILNSQPMRYVAKYCNKSTQKIKFAIFENSTTGEIQQINYSEFVCCSKRPFLGKSFLQKYPDYFKDIFLETEKIKIDNFEYSLPLTFKRYAKKENFDFLKDKVKNINICYNDIFGLDIIKNLKSLKHQLNLIDINNINYSVSFIPFSSFYSEQKEKLFSYLDKLKKKKNQDYYLNFINSDIYKDFDFNNDFSTFPYFINYKN